MWIRPTALYQGNDNDTVIVNSVTNPTVTGKAEGVYSDTVVARVDTATTFASNSTFSYSYSLDGGVTWVASNTRACATAPPRCSTFPAAP